MSDRIGSTGAFDGLWVGHPPGQQPVGRAAPARRERGDRDAPEIRLRLAEARSRALWARLAANGDPSLMMEPAPPVLKRFGGLPDVDLPTLGGLRLDFAMYWPIPCGDRHSFTRRPWRGVLIDIFTAKPDAAEWEARVRFACEKDIEYLWVTPDRRVGAEFFDQVRAALGRSGWTPDVHEAEPEAPPDPRAHEWEIPADLLPAEEDRGEHDRPA